MKYTFLLFTFLPFANSQIETASLNFLFIENLLQDDYCEDVQWDELNRVNLCDLLINENFKNSNLYCDKRVDSISMPYISLRDLSANEEYYSETEIEEIKYLWDNYYKQKK